MANMDLGQQHPINIPRLPPDDFLDRDNYNTLCVPLYQASNYGDWPAARELLERFPELVRSSITENHDIALHIAVSAKCSTKVRVRFVENLLKMMRDSDLELQNGNGETALFVAAVAGHVQMAKLLVNRYPYMLRITDSKGEMPISVAALYGKHEMVKYLYNLHLMNDHSWTYEDRNYLLMKCIEANLFDIALDIVGRWPEHATSGNVLRALARKPDKAFKRMLPPLPIFASYLDTQATAARQLLRTNWEIILNLDKNQIDDIIRGPHEESATPGRTHYPSQMLFIAAEKGNTTFVSELTRKYPDLIRKVNDEGQSIFHVAALHRRKGVFGRLYNNIGSIKNSIITLEDVEGNNLLHLIAKRVVDRREKDDKRKDDVSGHFLRMQEELRWFEAVKAMLPPIYQEKRNHDGLTPAELFKRDHRDLVGASEKWLKDFASQLMVVAVLIAAIAFAAPFAVPGGWDQDTGSPIFVHKRIFMAFIASDAASFLMSMVSIFALMCILTSPFTEHDFLEDLPSKMFISTATIVYALLAMTLTFLITLFIFNDNKAIWIFFGVFALILVTPFHDSLNTLQILIDNISIYDRSPRLFFDGE